MLVIALSLPIGLPPLPALSSTTLYRLHCMHDRLLADLVLTLLNRQHLLNVMEMTAARFHVIVVINL